MGASWAGIGVYLLHHRRQLKGCNRAVNHENPILELPGAWKPLESLGAARHHQAARSHHGFLV